MPNVDSNWIAAEDLYNELSSKIDSLQYQIETMQRDNAFLFDIIQSSNSGISNQLTTAGILLALVALIITLVGAAIGLYVRRRKQEIEKIAQTIEEKKKTVDGIAETTKKLEEQIHSNIKDLYAQLRKEETRTLLDRLVYEPRDITNLLDVLLARDLEDSGFPKLKEAFFKYKDSETEEGDKQNNTLGFSFSLGFPHNYMLLFFQHFCNLSIKDDEIRPFVINGFEIACKQAFKRDIIKSTIDLCKALSDEESTFNKEDVLVSYLKALNGTKYRSLSDLKNIFEQNLTPDTLLSKAIERCSRDGVNLVLFTPSKTESKKN